MVAWQAPRGQAARVPFPSVTGLGFGEPSTRTPELWKLLGALQKLRAATWFVVIGRGVVSRNLHTSDGREAHLGGPIATALMAKADGLLGAAPDIKAVDVLAAKL